MSHLAATTSPHRGENATSTSAQPKQRYPLPPSQISRGPSEFSITSALSQTSHIATIPLLSASSPSLNFSNPPSRPTRQFFSSPPSPSTLGSIAPAPNPMTTIQHPVVVGAAGGDVGGGANNAHEKMWLEMQQKLEEVSLSGGHVFGSNHAKSLEGLRTAQAELAQAWMRSEEDDLDNKHSEFGKQAFAGRTGEEDTENDILLAVERRRANDEHFNRVALSVVDVTAKLENVARAMAGVELESRGIWVASSDSEVSSMG